MGKEGGRIDGDFSELVGQDLSGWTDVDLAAPLHGQVLGHRAVPLSPHAPGPHPLPFLANELASVKE